MSLERRNPLPIGVYSVDLPNHLAPEFHRWQSGRSAVKVIKTNDDGQFAWILFSVTAPTLWATGLGFPSHAQLTDERPQAFEPSKDPLDKIADWLPSPQTFTTFALVGGVVIASYFIFQKELLSNVKRKLRSGGRAWSRRSQSP